MSLRDQIAAANDLETVEEDVPEWGFTVFLRRMSAAEGLAFYEACQVKDSTHADMMLGLLQRTLCEADGTLLYGPEDVEELGTKSMAVIRRLFNKAGEFNLVGAENGSVEGN